MRNRGRIIAVWTLCFCVVGVYADKEPDISYLPAPVQRVITEWKGEGDLKKVRTRQEPSGTVYEIDYKERGDEKSLVVAPDGTVLSESSGKGNDKGKNKDKDKGKGKDKGEEDKDKGGEVRKRDGGVIAVPPARQPAPLPTPVPAPGGGQQQMRNVAWGELPQPVKESVSKQSDLGKVQYIRMETRKGKSLYHAHFEKGIASYDPAGKMVDSRSYWN